MRLAAICIFFFVFVSQGLAQSPYSSSNDFFKVAEIRGCAPFDITIFDAECTSGCFVNFEYAGVDEFEPMDPNIPSTFRHTYTTPGTYEIRLVHNDIIDRLQITVFENIQPNVEVTNCGDSRVHVNILDNNYDEYVITYDNQNQVVVPPGTKHIHDYGAPGSQTVIVEGRNFLSEPNCNPTSVAIDVLDVIPQPVITRVEVLDQSNIRIEHNGINNVSYRLELVAVNNTSVFQIIRTLYNEPVYTIPNLRPEDNFYCFRISAFNACENQPISSDVVCTANFDLEVLNNENRVTWTSAATGIADRELAIVNQTNGGTLTIDPLSSPYRDTDLQCGTTYCYQLTLTFSNNSKSVSMQKCGVAISTDTPAPVSNIATQISNDAVLLQWLQPVGFAAEEYTVLKSVADDYGPLAETSATTFNDNQYTLESGSCYKIEYTDVCGNESSRSIEACPLILTGSVTAENHVSLSWTEYQGYQNGVHHYAVEKYAIGGTLLQSTDVPSGTTYTDDSEDLTIQLYLYIVKAIPNVSGLPISISNDITIIKDPNLFYPAAFTPNGDNLNDVFNVFGQYITRFEMDIYNRWGELMFTTNNLDTGWDGNYKGNPMPEGTYTFVATIVDFAGRTFKRSGSVLLLRKK